MPQNNRLTLDQRVDDLVTSFDRYLARFRDARIFTGPSVYFHHRTLERLRCHRSPSEAIQDSAFVESLYAMLAAWGMHRMGPMGAKLSNFEIISSNFARQVDAVKKHETKKLAEVSAEELPAITGTLWNIISGLKISASQTQIVAGSKALHHIVPDLVPPIDREYTIQFVYGYKRNTPSQAEFARILATFHTVANSLGQHLEDIVRTCRDDRSQMDTSATKLIDNAIVGYALLHPYAVQPPTDPK